MKNLNEAKILAQQKANETGIVQVITDSLKIYPIKNWSGTVLETIKPQLDEIETEKPTKVNKDKDKAKD